MGQIFKYKNKTIKFGGWGIGEFEQCEDGLKYKKT